MRGAYIDYSMSVIVSRALPDVRDGLKPVHRRVLFGMSELGVFFDKPYKKSARIVGEVLGKYHPHGDTSVYDTMVRMAQPWSLRYPLVDGQGNFGSPDGDAPAAMRYTEARLKKVAGEMLADMKKNTVDFQANFDDTLKEPAVLPSKLPNLLVNGSSGIAVGMATNMAPNNLNEVVDGIVAYIDNRDISIAELMQHITAPDFPTGAIIYGYEGVRKAYETGRGRIVLRSHVEVEEGKNGRLMLVATSTPYQVNKSVMIEKTAALVNEKKIEGISDIRDESDRKGTRVVYELRRDAIPEVVLNNLYKYTALQSSFSVNNIALVKGRPQVLNLKQLIEHYVNHRHEVILRRTRFELDQAEKRAHILEGLLKALDHIDQIIALIRGSKDPDAAREGLMTQFEFSELQARAILDMRLQRLTGLERDKLQAEYDELLKTIAHLKAVLESEQMQMDIIKEELREIQEKYGDERRTEIVIDAEAFEDEDMIPNDEMVVSISKAGYIKRTPLEEYRVQGRGGVGSRGVGSKDDDFTEHLFIASNHNYLLFFTSQGKVYWLKTYKVPEGGKTAKGRAIQNLIQIEEGDYIQAVINVAELNNPDFVSNHFLVMCTTKGIIKKTPLEAYSRPRQNGINAINITEGDSVWDVQMTDGNSDIIMAVRSGRAIRFNESAVRAMGRTATGVRGISLENEEDCVVGLVCVDQSGGNLLVVSEKGYGKRSDLEEYRITNRGGKGIKTLNITEKTGYLVNIKGVSDEDELMIMTKSGLAIRMEMSTLRVMGRATQGVRLIRLNEGDTITSVARIQKVKEDGEIGEANPDDTAGETPADPEPSDDNTNE